MARTAKQRAALRKAQLASARKRRKGRGSKIKSHLRRNRTVYAAGAVLAGYGAAAVYGSHHKAKKQRARIKAIGAERTAHYNKVASASRTASKKAAFHRATKPRVGYAPTGRVFAASSNGTISRRHTYK